MSRPSALPLRLLIPVVAACAAFLVSRLPWDRVQELYLLHPTFARSGEREAKIELSGMQWPRVGIAMVEYERGTYVRVTLTEKEIEESEESEETEEIKLVVPASWELQEVSGAHARDVTQEASEHGRRSLASPNEEWRMENGELRLLFRTRESFDHLRFAHDSPYPALLNIAQALYPRGGKQRMTFFVKEMRTVEL
ncbi:MAG: hypothetical protein AAB853_03740 [Patescibacteria group bacterium]